MKQYEVYKKIRTQKEYFDNWDAENLNAITALVKERLYKKHVEKAKTFQRDNFTCRNKVKQVNKDTITYTNCPYCDNTPYHDGLTFHHVKFRKNGGKDNARNGVTLCKGSHKNFHKARDQLGFDNSPELPSHIRGHTFKLDIPDKVDWKKLKAQMRDLRRELKQKGLKPIVDWEVIAILLKWLFIPFDEEDD